MEDVDFEPVDPATEEAAGRLLEALDQWEESFTPAPRKLGPAFYAFAEEVGSPDETCLVAPTEVTS